MFKKAVAVLLLLTTPFAQARAVLVCSMMDGQVVERCCCPGHAEHIAPNGHHDAPDAACCDVVVEVSDKTFAGVSADQPTLKRAAQDVQDLFVLATAAPLVATFAVAPGASPRVDVAQFVPDRLYLRTARLRL